MSTNNICFRIEIRKILVLEKVPYLGLCISLVNRKKKFAVPGEIDS